MYNEISTKKLRIKIELRSNVMDEKNTSIIIIFFYNSILYDELVLSNILNKIKQSIN